MPSACLSEQKSCPWDWRRPLPGVLCEPSLPLLHLVGAGLGKIRVVGFFIFAVFLCFYRKVEKCTRNAFILPIVKIKTCNKLMGMPHRSERPSAVMVPVASDADPTSVLCHQGQQEPSGSLGGAGSAYVHTTWPRVHSGSECGHLLTLPYLASCRAAIQKVLQGPARAWWVWTLAICHTCGSTWDFLLPGGCELCRVEVPALGSHY